VEPLDHRPVSAMVTVDPQIGTYAPAASGGSRCHFILQVLAAGGGVLAHRAAAARAPATDPQLPGPPVSTTAAVDPDTSRIRLQGARPAVCPVSGILTKERYRPLGAVRPGAGRGP
jgi:hypothetical protein